MADNVPMTGAWQTDAELMRLGAALSAALAGPPRRGQADREAQAFNDYVNRNRQRLGIPDNYYPDPTTGYQTLYDPNQNQLRDALLTGGAMAGGAAGLGAALGGGASAAAGGAPEFGISTTPADGVGLSSAVGAASADSGLGAFPGLGSTADGIVPGGINGGLSSIPRGGLTGALSNPGTLTRLLEAAPALAMSLGGGGGNPFGSGQISDEIGKALGMQNQRMKQAQPAYDTLVRMAYGMTPSSYQGPAPDGMSATPDPNAPRYTAPTFGVR